MTPLQQSVERYFQLLLFAMIVTGFISLVATGRLDVLSLMFVGAALAVKALHLARRNPFVLSEKVTSRLTIVYVLFYVLDLLFLSGSFITATVHLVLFIMVVTMFAVQRERYNVYLIVIAFMMVLAAAILTIDSFFLGAFFVFSLLAVATFICMEMRRSFRAAEKRTASSPASLARPLSRSLGRTAAGLVLGIFIGIPVIFYMLPRWSFGRLSQLAAANLFVAGFGSEVKLGEIGRIQQTDQVAMHVTFLNGSQPPADMYWHGVTLSHFDGKRWYNDRVADQSRSFVGFTNNLNFDESYISKAFLGMPSRHGALFGKHVEYRVLMEPLGTNVVFLLSTPTALESEVRRYAVTSAAAVGYEDPTRQIRAYKAEAAERLISPNAEQDTDTIPSEIAALYLQIPDKLDPQVTELAQQLTKGEISTVSRARAIETYLQTKFAYTLDMETKGSDPIAYFLFDRKKGHCEYFASSMALMLRTIGIPARIVNGFRGGEYNDISGSYIVRARDAHSWVEAYIPGHGWHEFDPTPAADPIQRDRWARLLLYLDAAREFWGEWVINYDFSHQRELSHSTVVKTRETFDSLRMTVREWYDRLLERARKTQQDATLHPQEYGVRTVVLLATLLFIFNVRSLWLWICGIRVARRPEQAPRLAASIWYDRLIKLLRRKGYERQPAQTAEEFAASIETETVREEVVNFAEHYERARFGDSASDAEKLPELYDEVEEALKH